MNGTILSLLLGAGSLRYLESIEQAAVYHNRASEMPNPFGMLYTWMLSI